ncbi:MAG: WYL domain-containing protein [Chloroflexota bacterium]
MKPTRAVARSVRLAQIQYALHKRPDGLTSHELAELCGVCVRTVQRDLFDLQVHLNIPLIQNGDRYGIVSDYRLPPVSLSAYEAIALFLACRLALRQADKNNPHMRQALDKVSAAMPEELAARLKVGIGEASEEADTNFAMVFEAVGLAWMTQRQVSLSYLSARDNELREWVLEPYFMEMSGAGRSTYVIGHAYTEGLEGLISFRLDRVKTAEILPTSFEAPSDDALEQLLSSAWGTMWKEQTEVRFELPANLIRQSRERGAHLPQSIVGSPGDIATVALHISSWLEVHPWIRSTTSNLLELTPELIEQHFDEHIRKLKQSCGMIPAKTTV